MRRGMEAISLWLCSGVMEAQVALIAAFRSSALLGLVSLIFLLTIHQRFSMGFRSGEFADQSSTVTHGHWTSFWYIWQCGQVPSPAGKWNQNLHKACQQKEAWSALKYPGRWLRWLWTSENTVDQHQQMTWQPKSSLTVETSHWTSRNMDSVPLHSSSRLWDSKFTLIWKEDWLWTTDQQSSSFSLFSPGKMLLTMFQFTPCEALPSVWIGFAWQYSQACLCTFSYPISSFQSTLHIFNMLWYSSPWTATPFSNDPLWLSLFVEGVNDRLLDHCQVSSVPHYCGFKEQVIPRIYTVWIVIYWNSNVNILIFCDTDFWLSLAVSSNHQNKNFWSVLLNM